MYVPRVQMDGVNYLVLIGSATANFLALEDNNLYCPRSTGGYVNRFTIGEMLYAVILLID